VVAALQFAEKCGIEYVEMPALAFIKTDELDKGGHIPDDHWARLHDQLITGLYTFLQIPGRRSVKFVLLTMPYLTGTGPARTRAAS
jgi:hypothetical protein